jgi:hypothetical protein
MWTRLNASIRQLASCDVDHQPPEKCAPIARAKLPKPPREVSPPLAPLDVPEDEAESPPKKLVRRDQYPPEPPWPPPE